MSCFYPHLDIDLLKACLFFRRPKMQIGYFNDHLYSLKCRFSFVTFFFFFFLSHSEDAKAKTYYLLTLQ